MLIGRFLGPIRSTIPTVAGVMGMAHGRFQLANVSSAILWMPLMLAPGYVTARSLGSAENAQQIAMLIGAGFSVLLGVGLLVAMLRKREAPAAPKRDAPPLGTPCGPEHGPPEALARFSLDGAPLRTGEAGSTRPRSGRAAMRWTGCGLRGWHIVLE